MHGLRHFLAGDADAAPSLRLRHYAEVERHIVWLRRRRGAVILARLGRIPAALRDQALALAYECLHCRAVVSADAATAWLNTPPGMAFLCRLLASDGGAPLAEFEEAPRRPGEVLQRRCAARLAQGNGLRRQQAAICWPRLLARLHSRYGLKPDEVLELTWQQVAALVGVVSDAPRRRLAAPAARRIAAARRRQRARWIARQRCLHADGESGRPASGSAAGSVGESAGTVRPGAAAGLRALVARIAAAVDRRGGRRLRRDGPLGGVAHPAETACQRRRDEQRGQSAAAADSRRPAAGRAPAGDGATHAWWLRRIEQELRKLRRWHESAGQYAALQTEPGP